MNRLSLVLVLAFAGVGCGDDDGGGGGNPDADVVFIDAAIPDASIPDAQPQLCTAPIDPGPNHHQFVGNRFLLPTTVSKANQYGLNIDGDKQDRPDNALGSILATLGSQLGFDIQGAMDGQIDSGALIYLFDVLSADISVSKSTLLSLVQGQDCDVPLDPIDNFSGDEPFLVAEATANDAPLSGGISGGSLDLGPGEVTIQISFPGVGLIELPLVGARIVGDLTATGITDGRIGGAIKEEVINTTFIPALALGLQAFVSGCTGAPPNCCAPGSTEETVLSLFDEDMDCAITQSEVENNSLISALFAPDVDLFNGDTFEPRVDGINDSLSLGIGFTAVGAQFEAVVGSTSNVCTAYEPNETLATAPTITAGTYQLSICTGGDKDFFRFAVTDGIAGAVDIQIDFDNNKGAGDLELRLYDSTGMLIDQSMGFGDVESITRDGLTGGEPLAIGEYVLEVYGFNAAVTSDYQLTLAIDPILTD